MDKAEIDRRVGSIEARIATEAHKLPRGRADDGFEIARAMLQVFGRRLGVDFVRDVQVEVLNRAEEMSPDEDPRRRGDAIEVLAVATAGYFEDLVEELERKGATSSG